MADFKLIIGKMGGGKTYTAVEEVLRCLREGGYAHTNIPMDLDYLELNGWLDRYIQIPDDVTALVSENPREKNPDGTWAKKTFSAPWIRMGREGAENIIVIDEAAIQFDTDTYTSEKARHAPIKNLIALTRHLGLDIYMVSQSSTGVAPVFRKLAKQTIHCTNVAKIEMLGWLLVKIPWYGDLRRVYYAEQSTTPSATTWHRWDVDVFAAYNTHGHRGDVNAVEGATRKRTEDPNNTRSKRIGKIITCCFLAGALYIAFQSNSLYSKYTEPGEPKQAAATPTKKPEVAPVFGLGTQPIQPQPASRSKTVFAEWSPETDEFVMVCSIRDHRGQKFQIQDGRFLKVGAVFEGEMLESFVKYGDVYYFKTAPSGRWIVLRPITQKERQQMYAEKQPKKGEAFLETMKGKF